MTLHDPSDGGGKPDGEGGFEGSGELKSGKTIRLEVRPFPDGRGIDEVLSTEVEFFHLEYMDKDSVWIGLDLKDGSMVHLRLNSKKPIKLLVEHEWKGGYKSYE